MVTSPDSVDIFFKGNRDLLTETLLRASTNETLTNRIRFGGPHRGSDDLDPPPPGHLCETLPILAVIVSDQDGLLTNDKFCFVREGALKLSHWRGPLRKRDLSLQQRTLLIKRDQSGVDDVSTTAVAHSTNQQPNRRRSTLAYQCLLKWSQTKREKETTHESSSLRQGVDPAPGRRSDD